MSRLSERMKQQKVNKHIKFGSQTVAFFLGLLILLVLINAVSLRYFARLDLTEDKQYTLTETSRDFILELDDVLNIKAYFTQELPPDLLLVRQFLGDILDEYKSISPNVRVEFVDPSNDPQLKAEAESIGIPEIQVTVFEQDSVAAKNGFLGIGFFYKGKTEVLPIINSTDNLEYQISSVIRKVSTTEVKKIGFISGHGEAHLFDPPIPEAKIDGLFITARKALEQIYDVEVVSLGPGDKLTDVDTLVIGGPKSALSERDTWVIDQFIMEGGDVIFMIEPALLGLNLQADTNETGLQPMIEKYGVRLNSDFVLDANNVEVGFSVANRQFITPYPLWVRTLNRNHSQHPTVSELESVVFPWISSLEVLEREGVESEILIKSSVNASNQTAPFNVAPNQAFATEFYSSQYNLVAFMNGTYKSYFAGQPVPVKNDPDAQSSDVNIDESVEPAKIVVIGDDGFIDDNQLNRFPDNLALFLNLVDFVTLDDNLINIRAKTLTDRPVSPIEDNAKNYYRIVNIVVVPFIVIVVGGLRTAMRKKKKRQGVMPS